jgi:hypothetical protein
MRPPQVRKAAVNVTRAFTAVDAHSLTRQIRKERPVGDLEVAPSQRISLRVTHAESIQPF